METFSRRRPITSNTLSELSALRTLSSLSSKHLEHLAFAGATRDQIDDANVVLLAVAVNAPHPLIEPELSLNVLVRPQFPYQAQIAINLPAFWSQSVRMFRWVILQSETSMIG